MAKEMTAVEYFKEKKRMVRLNDLNTCELECNKCPLSEENNGKDMNCADFEMNYPEIAVDIVEKWNEANHTKTMKEDLLEKFSNAKMFENGLPQACAGKLYGVSCVKKGHYCDCVACWDRPLEV